MDESRLNSYAIFKVPGGVYVLVGIFALVGSVFLWGEGRILDPPADVDLAFPVAEPLINAPAPPEYLLFFLARFTLKKN